MTPEQANARTRAFFGDLDGYRHTHAPQIAEIGRMPAHEARWAGVTRSEGNVAAALDAIEQPGVKPVAGDPVAGRQSLGTAVAQANEAGRLPLSESIEARLRAAFPQEMPPTLARAPAVPDADAPHGAPGTGRTMRVVGAAGLALMAYDLVSTGHQVMELRAAGNEAAAEAAQTRFIGRNAGGLLVGVGAGFVYGAATGSWSGPGALVTGVIGGAVGAYLGDKWADQKQLDQIYIQTDVNGNEWSRNPTDPQGPWQRTAPVPNAAGGFEEGRFVAAGRLVDELNYRSANDSYSIGLGSPPTPQNPFSIESAQDQPGWLAARWQRDAQSGEWSRTLVAEGMLPELQMVPEMRTETATAAQTAQLEQQSALIVANNAANTPAVIAARYQIAYEQFGWNAFAANEPVPGAIRNAAAQTQTLQASDGNTYTRAADGEWTRPWLVYFTSPAEGNIREELNRTWESQRAGLQEMSEYAAVARANPTPTEHGLRESVVSAYARARIPRSEADIDAATRAVTQDHARDGLGQSPYSLKAQPDGSIATLVGRDDQRMEIKSVTTAAEIEQARTQPASPTVAPQSDTPAPSPTTRPPDPSPERHTFDDGSRPGGHAATAMARAESATPAPLDDAANPRNGMFRQAFEPVRVRDVELGRASDDASVQLAAGMTAEARARGLKTIEFAQFSPDGRQFHMADTPDPSLPWARTAVGDVAQCLQYSVAESSQRVAQLDQAQSMAQQLATPAQEQTRDQGGPVVHGLRLV